MQFHLLLRTLLITFTLCASLNLHPGWLNATASVEVKHEPVKLAIQELIQEFVQSVKALLDEQMSQEKKEEIINTLTTAFNNSVDHASNRGHLLIDHADNTVRLYPIYLLGATSVGMSVNLSWQALNDYLNNTETSPEARQTLKRKIAGKLKTALALVGAGVGTFYFSQEIASICCGYRPPSAII